MHWKDITSPFLAAAFITTRTKHGASSERSSSYLKVSSSGTSLELAVPSKPIDQSKYDGLLKWIKSKGESAVVHPAIAIAPSARGGGYGVFVTEPVKEGDLLLNIPRSACVTMDDIESDPISGPIFRKLIEKAGSGGITVCLAGFLARERLRSLEHQKAPELVGDSSFGPYLDTLPWERGINNQEHTLYWGEDMVDKWLIGTMGFEEVIALRDEVDLAIKVLNGIVGKTIRELRGEQVASSGFKWPWEASAEKEQNAEIVDQLPESIKGAFVTLLTRAFQDGDDDNEKLVPLVDIMQHCEDPNISHVMVKETGAVKVVARTDLPAGQELFNQYRSELEESMPYHRFFTRYGFVPGIIDEDIQALLEQKSPIFFAQKGEV